MPRRLPPKPGEKPQFERFIDAAKKSGAADTDEGLAGVVRAIAPNHEAKRDKGQGKTRKA
jgi:hypothetical protein